MSSIDEIKDHLSYHGYDSEDLEDGALLFKSDNNPSFIFFAVGIFFKMRFPFGVKEDKETLTILEEINKQNIKRVGKMSYKDGTIFIDYEYVGNYDKKTFSDFIDFQKLELMGIVNDFSDMLQ